MKTHKSANIKIWIVVLIMGLTVSCENENLNQEPVLSPIANYIPSSPPDDMVFSSIQLVKSFYFGGGISTISYDKKLFSFGGTMDIASVGIYDIATAQQTHNEYHLNYNFNYWATFIFAAGKALIAGGYNSWRCQGNECWSTAEKVINLVSIYDIDKNRWSKGYMSTTRSNFTAASLGNLVFFAGGIDIGTNYTSKVIDVYNTTTEKWVTAQLSIPRYNIAAGSAGDKILFAGGNTNWTNYAVGDSGITDRVDIYDASTGKWSTDHLSCAREQMIAASCGNKIYFISGISYYYYANWIDVYDVTSNTWSKIPMDNPKSYDKCLVAGNLIFFTESDFNVKSIDMYNTSTGVWTTLPYTPPRANSWDSPDLVTVVDNKLFLSNSSDNIYMYELK
jgi:hypothetical protein